MTQAKREVEIKFRIGDPAEVENRLLGAGGHFEGAFHEVNRFYDDRFGTLAHGGRVLRLRSSSGRAASSASAVDCRLTYKEPLADPRFKVRTEIEVRVDDCETAALMLDRLGYRMSLEYEKERSLWHLGEVLVTVDRLTCGRFLELEGEPRALETAAEALGFDMRDGITKSYPELLGEAADE